MDNKLGIDIRDLTALVDLDTFSNKHGIKGLAHNVKYALNRSLYAVMASYQFDGINDNYMLVNKIEFTSEGLRFNIDNLINKICEFYDLENDERLVDNLRKLENNLDYRNIDDFINRTPSIKKTYYEYGKNKKISKQTYLDNKKSMVINKMTKDTDYMFIEKMKKNINIVIFMVYHKSDYEKVNPFVLDKNRLNLYIAYQMIDQMNENGISCEYIEELLNYIKDNLVLVQEEYQFFGYTGTYSINRVFEYVMSYLNEINVPHYGNINMVLEKERSRR